MGNPEPAFLMRKLRVVDSRILKGAHLKLTLLAGVTRLDAIAFGMADRTIPSTIDVVAQLQVNVWNGRSNLQLRIKDFRESD
jgi:single-stranded-DNA-specific exonuclease